MVIAKFTNELADIKMIRLWDILTLWKLFIVLNCCVIHFCESKRRFCRDFKTDFSASGFEEKVLDAYSDECPLSTSAFRIFNVLTGNETDISTLLICWSPDVRSFVLHFDDTIPSTEQYNLAAFDRYSCLKENDTVVVRHRQIRNQKSSKLLLKLSLDSRIPYTFRASVHVVVRKPCTHKHRILHFKYIPEVSKISKRSVITDTAVTQVSECGVTKSCFRFGNVNCGHLSCNYFLSYKVESRTLLELELSGLTSGWVAVGFSSDQNMGGDEVIMCSKTGPMSGELQAGTYLNNYVHNRPTKSERQEIVTLLQSEVKDDYIYCRISRPLSSEGYMDLTNDWHQLYAAGPVSQGGELEKHLTTPIVSKRITVLRTENLQNVHTSGAIFVTYSMKSSVLSLMVLLLFAI